MPNTIEKNARIALIGLGAMGSKVGERLLANGHELTVFNRDASRAKALVSAGATLADSPALAVRDAQVVLTCLRGASTELDLATGPSGYLTSMKSGAIHVSLSTLAPEAARALAGVHAANGTAFLSCPMQGRAQSIVDGQLFLWASGPKKTLTRVEHVLRSFSLAVCHVGESVESAPASKLAINMLMFANIELFAEATAYLKHCEIDPDKVFSVLTSTMFSTPLFKGIAAGLKGNHTSDGTNVGTSLRDLEMLMEHSRSLGARLPAAFAVTEQFRETVKRGYGELAQTAVVVPLSEG